MKTVFVVLAMAVLSIVYSAPHHGIKGQCNSHLHREPVTEKVEVTTEEAVIVAQTESIIVAEETKGLAIDQTSEIEEEAAEKEADTEPPIKEETKETAEVEKKTVETKQIHHHYGHYDHHEHSEPHKDDDKYKGDDTPSHTGHHSRWHSWNWHRRDHHQEDGQVKGVKGTKGY